MRGVGVPRWALCALLASATGAGAVVPPPSAAQNDGLWAPAKTARLAIEPAPPGRLPWVVFDERSGLPQHTIVDLLTDQKGFVWAATQDGAARYDGRTWEAVPLPREMGTNYPRAMRTAKDGGLWIGSFDGGVAHLLNGAWTITDMSSGLPSNRVRGLLETTAADGTAALWIATESGVARLQGGRITVFGADSGLPSLDTEALAEVTDENGNRSLFVGTANGLARFAGDRFVPVPVPRQILGHRIGDIVESTGLGGGRGLWIASYGAGMAVLEGGAWTLLDTTSGLPSNVEVLTKSAAEDGSPALWIGTEGGLIRFEYRRFEHGRFTLFDERCGLPIRIIWKVLETTAPNGQKTVWLGTWGGGVVRLSPTAWTTFDSTSGMPSGSVTSTLVTQHGAVETIWAGTSDGQLARFDGRRFQSVPLPAPLQHTIIFSLLETADADGGSSLWVGGFGGGVGRLKDGRWSMLETAKLPNERVYKIAETKTDEGKSVLWFCTESGLGRLEGDNWTYFRKGAELPSEIVTEVLETTGADGTRSIWAATSRGLARLHAGRWSVLGKESGLLSENIVSLAVSTDSNGKRWLWLGTLAGGASRMPLNEGGENGASPRWETLTSTSTPALPSDTVMSVAEDHQHRVYLFTTRGVVRLTERLAAAALPAAVPAATATSLSPWSAELFTTDDGLPSGDCQQSARFIDRDGRVWAGTARGLAMLDPRRERPDHAAKPLVIESSMLSDKSRTLRGGESLSHAERNLTFVSALLAYGGESRIRYRYQLKGFDPQPSEWTAGAIKEYTNLGAGDYVFLVWGKDARGNIAGPEGLAFQVRPAPWLTSWAFVLYTLALFAVGYGATQWRLRAMARRTRELEHVVAERTHDLVAARDQLEQLAALDGLTGIANRRIFDTTLAQSWKRAQRGGPGNEHWISLVLLDVDFFKRYNDRYGHARGDACLQSIAKALAAQCRRPADLVARYGGEEFVLILPDTEPAGVRALLASVLAAVDALEIEHAGSACAPHITVSIGAVSLRPGPDDDRLAALERADRLLYESKASGRHRATHEDEQGKRRIAAGGAGARLW